MLDLCGGDVAMLHKFIGTYYAEPILQTATVFDDTTMHYLQRALVAQSHSLAPPLKKSA
jgi:hypothetical protein